ncbi:MAG: ammonium transporter [Anaerohalosphaeraceae bacterium]
MLGPIVSVSALAEDAVESSLEAAPSAAAPVSTIDTGDTAWVLISAALVMIMTPGLAFFYGGLVRRKNYLNVLMQCMIILAVLSVQWVVFGYSLSFAPGSKWLGGLQWSLLNGVGLEPYADYSATIPHQAFMIFQAMFAVITPALIIGAFAERMKFSAFLIFTVLWATLVYDPVAHWVWGLGGVLRNMGALDFAGGTVVHINAGIAALVTAIVIGKRKSVDKHTIPPHSLPFSVLGAALLWFGWFGFNAGSALSANGLAANAFVVTHTAAAAAALTWALIDWRIHGAPTMLGTISGAVAGLVAITPAAGFVGIGGALIIGVMVSVFCFIAVSYLKPKFGYDDALDAFGVHGIGGLWGALATGLFATKSINPLGADGLFYGNAAQFWIQIKACAITIVYAFIVTWILYKIVDMLVGMRVDEKEEAMGLDITQHNERAYTALE